MVTREEIRLREENRILKGLLKGYWEELDGAAFEQIHQRDLGSRIRNVAVNYVNDDDAYSLEDALNKAHQRV